MSPPIWLTFQREVLDELGAGASFSAVSLANKLNIDTSEASEWIQNYLAAQRGKRSQTKYMLYRQARTSAAVWTIGRKTTDARARLGQFGDDIVTTLRRAVRPDIHRIVEVNPRAGRAVDEALDPLIEVVGRAAKAVMLAVGFPQADDDDDEAP